MIGLPTSHNNHLLLFIFGVLCTVMFSALAPSSRADNNAAFLFPVACTLGDNCWIINYFDTDPSQGVADFKCGHRSYDGHKGVDFAVASETQMNEGVNVLAAQDGIVMGARDGMDDLPKTDEDKKRINQQNKDCGNGVRLQHDNGYVTQYCHMKRGSINVQSGQFVKAGDVIGQVGQSGFTSFPHVHFSIEKDGQHIDPYTALPAGEGCNLKASHLWDSTNQALLSYTPASIFNGGLTTKAPDFNLIRKLGHTPAGPLRTSTKALYFWVALFGARDKDTLILEIKSPDGEVLNKSTIAFPRDRALEYMGLRHRSNGIEYRKGAYTGHAKLIRDNKLIAQQSFSIRLQ